MGIYSLNIIAIAFLLVLPVYPSVYALNAAKVYEKVSGSVYTVHSFEADIDRYKVLGSAVAVSKNILATNCHVAQLGEFRIKVNDKFEKGVLSFQDYHYDLCLIKVENTKLNPVKLRYSADVEIGEDVFTIGNPHGLEKSISRGIISNKYDFKHGSVLQTDATISLGSSGGGLFDSDANLIGITRAGHRYKDIAFTIPTEWIKVILSGEKPQWLPDKKIILQELGIFGESKIGLYRFDGHCFLYFSGKGLEERDQGSIVWFPNQKHQVFFLPLTVNVQDAVVIMIDQGFDLVSGLEIKKTTKEEIHPIIQPVKLLVKKLDYDPVKRFQSGKDVTMQYVDVYHQRSSVSMSFGLMGFSQALRTYGKLCKQPEDMQ